MFCNITMTARTHQVYARLCFARVRARGHKYISAHGWMGDLHGDLFAWIKCQFWKCVVIPELLRERQSAGAGRNGLT